MVLRSLPKTLDETYERILLDINANYRQEAIGALQWLAFSERPLAIRELAEAVVVDPRKEIPYDLEDRFLDSCDILKILSTLVTTYETEDSSQDDTMIRMAHFSVKEYLTSERNRAGSAAQFSVTSIDAHHFLTKSCLLYMKYYASAHRRCGKDLRGASDHEFTERFEEAPLLKYSCSFWMGHLKAISGTLEPSLINMVTDFLDSEYGRTDWLAMWMFLKERHMDWDYDDQLSILYHASYQGVECVVKMLLKGCKDLNAWSEYLGPALHAASRGGHTLVVESLLKAGAQINVEGPLYGTALVAASSGGHELTVKFLLDRGALVNIVAGILGTALQVASIQGHGTIVGLLLESKAELDLYGDSRGTALMEASACGQDLVVEQLIAAGVDVNVNGSYHRTALVAASRTRGHAIVQRLLRADAKVNAIVWPRSALQAASRVGDLAMVQILLDAGADVNAQSKNYIDLQEASQRGDEEQTTQLLNERANGKNPSDHGTALQLAAGHGHASVVRLLLSSGANVHAEGWAGTAMELALRRKDKEVIQLLQDALWDSPQCSGD